MWRGERRSLLRALHLAEHRGRHDFTVNSEIGERPVLSVEGAVDDGFGALCHEAVNVFGAGIEAGDDLPCDLHRPDVRLPADSIRDFGDLRDDVGRSVHLLSLSGPAFAVGWGAKAGPC